MIAEREVRLIDGSYVTTGIYELVCALVISGHDIRVTDDETVRVMPPIADDTLGVLDAAHLEVRAVLKTAGAIA